MSKIGLFTAIMVLVLSFNLHAQNMKRQMKMDGSNCEQTRLQDLGVSQEQISKLVSIKKESRDKNRKLKQELSELRDDFQDELDEDTLDESKLKQLADKISNIQKEMMLERVRSLKEVKKLLTKEQLEKLEFMRMMKPEKGMRSKKGMRKDNNRPKQKREISDDED